MKSFMRSALTCAMLLASHEVIASSVEITGGPTVGAQVVVSAVQTGKPSSAYGTYYNPTGIQIGNDFYLYVMGGNWDHGPGGTCTGDKIFAFKAPYTASSMYGPFQYVTRISPCDGRSYGPGQVFYDGSYRIVADVSDQTTFDELVLGTSADGVSWSWQDFIKTDSGIQILAPVLVGSTLRRFYCDPTCHSHHTWWGYFPFSSGFSSFTGRMQVDVSTKWPRGFRVSILSGGQWQAVNDLTGEFSFIPDNVWSDVSVRSLLEDDGRWELWAYRNVAHNGCTTCTGSYNEGFAGSTFEFREVFADKSFGPVEPVHSLVRCMPSNGHVDRLFPFRVNDPSGRKLLYSATNDENICGQPPGSNGFVGMYVVVTEVSD